MKKMILTAVVLFISASVIYATDFIRDDYQETNLFALHSEGLLTYGAHTNTFHIPTAFVRVNLNYSNIQFFVTLQAYKDTHEPTNDYQFILNNLNFYDFGVRYDLFEIFRFSARGAAVYSLNEYSLLLLSPYFYENNPGEFERCASYIPRFKNAAGVRIGAYWQDFEIGFSQADYRHNIPSAVMARWANDQFSVQGVVQFEHTNAVDFEFETWNVMAQLSTMGVFKLDQDWKVTVLAEGTWQQAGSIWGRFEEGVTWKNLTFALRQIVVSDKPFVAEASLDYNFYGIASLGIQAGTDGRIYGGTRIRF